MAGNFSDIKINVAGKQMTIKMEKGMVFENKGGKYCIFADGSLKFMAKGSGEWQDTKQINMTQYQWKAFQNIANNDGDAKTYSQSDVKKAIDMYKKGGFSADMSKDLPQGYKIENPDRDNSTYVAVNVTNGNESQSARLKFQISEVNALKEASQNKQTQSSINPPAATAKIKKIGGKIVRGKTTYWYHPGGKLAGMIDTLPNGKQKIMDAKGKTLYYVLDEASNNYDTPNGDITYYDKNNKPKYRLEYYGSDVHYNLHVLDKEENSIKKYNMNFDYEERDGFDIDFTGPDDYAKDDNVRYIGNTFGKLQDYNKEDGPYYSPVSRF